MPNMAIPREHREQFYNSRVNIRSEVERAEEEGRKEGIRIAREQLGINQSGQTPSGSLSPLDRALMSIPCGPLPVPTHGTGRAGLNNSLIENAKARAAEFESMKSAARQFCCPGEGDQGNGNAGSHTGAGSLLENARKRQQAAGQKGPLV